MINLYFKHGFYYIFKRKTVKETAINFEQFRGTEVVHLIYNNFVQTNCSTPYLLKAKILKILKNIQKFN